MKCSGLGSQISMRKASSLVRPAAALAARVHATAGASAFPLAARRLGAWGAQGNVRGFAKKKQEVVVNVSPQGSSKMLRAAVKSAIEGQDPEVRSNMLDLLVVHHFHCPSWQSSRWLQSRSSFLDVDPRALSAGLRARHAAPPPLNSQLRQMNNDDMEDIRPAGWVKVLPPLVCISQSCHVPAFIAGCAEGGGGKPATSHFRQTVSCTMAVTV